jgi:hypothetical protein
MVLVVEGRDCGDGSEGALGVYRDNAVDVSAEEGKFTIFSTLIVFNEGLGAVLTAGVDMTPSDEGLFG